MPDLKPPRLVADERVTLLTLIQYQRDSFVRKVAGVDEGRARQNPVVSGTNLLWLTKHMARAESLFGLFVALPDSISICLRNQFVRKTRSIRLLLLTRRSGDRSTESLRLLPASMKYVATSVTKLL